MVINNLHCDCMYNIMYGVEMCVVGRCCVYRIHNIYFFLLYFSEWACGFVCMLCCVVCVNVGVYSCSPSSFTNDFSLYQK